MPVIQVAGFQCQKCVYIWHPKRRQNGNDLSLPKVCPKCHSRRWNGPAKSPYYDYLNFVVEKDRLPAEIFIKSHVKSGHNQETIFDCVMELSKAGIVNNPKKWLEDLWRQKNK